MTPYEAVREEFDFPFELYPFQIDTVNQLSEHDRVGLYHEAGAGKTATSTHWALHKSLTNGVRHWLMPMPPILTLQWARWLASITDKRTGKSPTVTVYAGSPSQRKNLDLDVQFIPISYGLLRNDGERLKEIFDGEPMGLILDEGHAIKNIDSMTHKLVKSLGQDRHMVVLTGTPLTKPLDAYAYVKFLAPKVYRNMRQFEDIHVRERDEWGTVTQWQNLDLMSDNMKIHSSRILRREVQQQLPPITFTVVNYDLAPAHLKLYERITQERLVEFENGREINAISTQALYSALQQVVINWAHFDDDESREPAALDLIDEVFDEMEPGAKLVIVANFIRSNAYLVDKLQKYGAVAVYGDISAKGKLQALRAFTEDPSCRCILLQPRSAGFGIDGLQHVCSDMLYLEAPTTAPPFYQVAARLDREGQKNPVNCRIGIANKTVQVKMFKSLLQNDATINTIQGGYKDLKDAVFGR